MSARARALSPAERLCAAGAVAIAGSMLLPWYGIAFSGGLVKTPLDAFGFAQAALLLTAGAAAFLLLRGTAGHPLPPPLTASALLALSGAWSAALVAYLMVDRPDELAGSTQIGLRFGIFVALGGALALFAGGVRMRAEEPAQPDRAQREKSRLAP